MTYQPGSGQQGYGQYGGYSQSGHQEGAGYGQQPGYDQQGQGQQGQGQQGYGQQPTYGQQYPQNYGQQQYPQNYGQQQYPQNYGQQQYPQNYGQQQYPQNYGQQQYPQGYGQYGSTAPKPQGQGLPANIGQLLAIAVAAVAGVNAIVSFWNLGAYLPYMAFIALLSVLTLHPRIETKIFVPVIAASAVAVAITDIFAVIHTASRGSEFIANSGIDYTQLVLSLIVAALAVFWLLLVLDFVKAAPDTASPATERAGAADATPQTQVMSQAPEAQGDAQSSSAGYGDAQAPGQAQSASPYGDAYGTSGSSSTQPGYGSSSAAQPGYGASAYGSSQAAPASPGGYSATAGASETSADYTAGARPAAQGGSEDATTAINKPEQSGGH
ncbi:hypothetical protein GTV32_09295 [Gordonia sp. SID5947]|uniref:hypothetical protein n=1 Tax=Gordonia sp. SID5947 TaxID=2690315 RepID=UPI0013681911|nr:hypothetical protein [Gordonia sp. SID5947]MYR06491.1 hypothetical protein [Gordonia sp. SID5947]